MLKFGAVTVKELLLLARDRSGLLVLFVMPAILVVIITLVQEQVLRLTGQDHIEVLYLDLDGGAVGAALGRWLTANGLVVRGPDESWDSPEDLRRMVAGGSYRAGLVLPAGTTALLLQEMAGWRQQSLTSDTEIALPLPVQMIFDPAAMPGLRTGLLARVEMAAALTAAGVQLAEIDRQLTDLAGRSAPALGELFETPRLIVAPMGDGEESVQPAYNPVQQNVPAWALFGMFFTAIPIAGGLLRERSSGIWLRLRSLPVGPFILVAGKLAAYLLICCCQFLLIWLLGVVLFPLLGLPAFSVNDRLPAVLVVVLASGVAACACGILLGALSATYEQASTVGATAVVVAAAVGGVMVPVYAMPAMMRDLSSLSPLNWALTAFHDLLVRGLGFTAVLDELGRLAVFAAVILLLACWKLRAGQ